MDLLTRVQQALVPLKVALPQVLSDDLSSVLIAVGWNEQTAQEEILLTKRTLWVDSHKGQVSFPGGFWKSQDTTLAETALRECQEEIGLSPSDVEIWGALEPAQTHKGVWIYPWVGKMQFPYPFALNPGEVERLIFLPLKRLLEDGLKPIRVPFEGASVQSIGLITEKELVWGATARILDQFRARILRSS